MSLSPNVLLVAEESLAGLVAILSLEDAERATILLAPRSRRTVPLREEDREAFRRVGEGAAAVLDGSDLRLGVPVGTIGEGWDETAMLIAGCRLAAERGQDVVRWGVNRGDSLEGLTEAAERLRLVEALLAVDSGEAAGRKGPSIRLEAPLLDLTDRQVADLARELAAPIAG